MKKIPLYICGIMIMMVLVGCIRFDREYPDINWYTLSVDHGGDEAKVAGAPVLLIKKCSIVPLFSGKPLTFRVDEFRYEHDYYNQLVLFPEEMITEEIKKWFASSPAVSYVVEMGSTVYTEYTLTSRIVELYGDLRTQDMPAAVLALEITLLKTKNPHAEIIFRKTYTARVPLAELSITQVVNGWNTALRAILTECEGDVKKELHA